MLGLAAAATLASLPSSQVPLEPSRAVDLSVTPSKECDQNTPEWVPPASCAEALRRAGGDGGGERFSVAVTVAGQIRSLRLPQVQQHLLTTFSGPMYTSSFFFDVTPNATVGARMMQLRKKMAAENHRYLPSTYAQSATEAEVSAIKNVFNPVSWESADCAQTTDKHMGLVSTPYTCGATRRRRLLVHIRAEETRQGRRFDMVVATRPDLWYRDLDINAALMPAKRRTLLYFNDFLYIADRAAADDMMSYSVADDEQCDLTKCPLYVRTPPATPKGASYLPLSHAPFLVSALPPPPSPRNDPHRMYARVPPVSHVAADPISRAMHAAAFPRLRRQRCHGSAHPPEAKPIQ